MKQLFFGMVLGVSIAFGAMAADMRDVKVVNGTGYDKIPRLQQPWR